MRFNLEINESRNTLLSIPGRIYWIELDSYENIIKGLSQKLLQIKTMDPEQLEN